MNKKSTSIIVIICLVFFIFIIVGFIPQNGHSMSSNEAKLTAIFSQCQRDGLVIPISIDGDYNYPLLKWEPDNPNCSPFCEVNEETNQASVNFQCTGLIFF